MAALKICFRTVLDVISFACRRETVASVLMTPFFYYACVRRLSATLNCHTRFLQQNGGRSNPQAQCFGGTALPVAPWRYYAAALANFAPALIFSLARRAVVSISFYVHYTFLIMDVYMTLLICYICA